MALQPERQEQVPVMFVEPLAMATRPSVQQETRQAEWTDRAAEPPAAEEPPVRETLPQA